MGYLRKSGSEKTLNERLTAILALLFIMGALLLILIR